MVDATRHPPARWIRTLALLITVCALHFLRFGYDFGSSDQDEVIPAVLHAQQESVLASDWFVAGQAQKFNVRTPAIRLIQAVAQPLGLQEATALLYILTIVLIALGVSSVVRAFTPSQLAAALAILLLLVLTPRFTLGGNDLTHSLLVPSMMAWGFAIFGFAALLRHSAALAGVLFAASVWLQPLVGILVSVTVCLALVAAHVGHPSNGVSLRDAAVCGAIAICMSLPVLIPIAASETGHSGIPADRVYDILTTIRAPHHYLPSRFPAQSFVRFGVLVAAGVVGISFSPTMQRYRRDLLFVLGVIAFLCGVYYIAVELGESATVAKLQLFKLTVLAKLIAGTAVAISVAESVAALPWARRLSSAFHPGAALAVAIVIAAVVTGLASAGRLDGRVAYLKRMNSSWSELHTWARTSTPPDAIFAVPPSNSDMRTWSQRAIVINFKAFPFQSDLMAEWQQRLRDMTGDARLDSVFVPIAELDNAYERLSAPQLEDLRAKYEFSYVVRTTPLDAGADSSAQWVSVATFESEVPGEGALFVYRPDDKPDPVR